MFVQRGWLRASMRALDSKRSTALRPWGDFTESAVLALKPGQSLDLEQLQAFASERLARYKTPRRLHLVQALPRNPTGKILKYQLREMLAVPR
jgi:acyl-CoA synthetase (AMP-forming)/AMP-acid ligase II